MLFRPVLYICGMLTIIISVIMLIPVGYSYIYQDPEFKNFVLSFEITALLGLILVQFCKVPKIALSARHLYLLTTCSWMIMSVSGALPFIFADHPMTISDAIFESVSGITTTGSTVMSNLQNIDKSILLWRSLLQWIGGLGVIGMAVTILPFLRIGGMKLFQTESSDWSDKSLPRFQQFAKTLLLVYLLISMLCALGYWLGGMTPFDAINHAMTTISTGGYSTDDRSLSRFDLKMLWISTVFMIASAMPFTMYVHFCLRRSFKGLMDQQGKAFLIVVVLASGLLSAKLIGDGSLSSFEAITHATFNFVSIVTTTGYVSTDYTLWGQFSVAFFFVASFIGGCSGSTCGGMKIFRFQLSYLFLRDQLRKLVHPRGIFSICYNDRLIKQDIIVSAAAFSFMFFVSLAVITLLLTLIGVDFVTSISGTLTALANVGPGLGDIIGPVGNFSNLPDLAKWLLASAMILGRLEIFTVIILFSPIFWRG